MKTPERWCPLPRCVNVFADRCHGVTSQRLGVTSRYVVTSCDVVTSWQNIQRLNPSETSEIKFFKLVTFTFDLWSWPSKSYEILTRSMPLPSFGSLHQTVQPWERSQTDTHTHTHTHTQKGPIPYPRPLIREGIICCTGCTSFHSRETFKAFNRNSRWAWSIKWTINKSKGRRCDRHWTPRKRKPDIFIIW